MVIDVRGFEKVSFDEFKRSICDDKELYDDIILPKRETKGASGYDFISVLDVVIRPGEICKIPTGVKSYMNDDEVLLMVVRSGMGFKYNVRMCNQVGVIDSDYYGNSSNDGHIFVALQNEGKEDYVIKKGDAFCQGIFVKYLTCDNECEDFKKRESDY